MKHLISLKGAVSLRKSLESLGELIIIRVEIQISDLDDTVHTYYY
jgi:hypothetical protein